MVALSMDEARSELYLVESRLEECIHQAWAEFRSVMVSTHPGMRVRARRTLLQDLVVKHVEGAFSGVPGFRLIDSDTGRVLLIVADRLVLQFKKLDREFRTANLPTRTALDFDAQRFIEGLPPLPRLTVGYRLDQLETQIEGTYVIFGIKNRPVWWYRLDEGEGSAGAETIDLLPQAPQGGEGIRRRVGPKRVASSEKVTPITQRKK